jgi:hypothetical protein
VKPNRSIPAATVMPVLIYPDVREAVTLDDVAPAEWGGTLVEPG